MSLRPVVILVGVLLLAANLRAALAAYPPLLETARDELAISGGAAGLVQSAAVVMMGVGSFLAPWLGGRLGWERALTYATLILALGSLLRGVPVLVALVGGSLFVGLGIGVAGVLVTGVVKQHLAHRAGVVTGGYVVSMMVGATVTSAVAVPLAVGLGGWSFSLAMWAVPALLAAGAWWPVARRFPRHSDGGESAGLPWRNGFARLATLNLATSSVQFYGWLTWLSPYYQYLGWSEQQAALLQAVWAVAQIPSGLILSALAERRKRWVFWSSVSLSCGLLGTLGALLIPLPPVVGPWAWVMLSAIGVSSFPLGLAMVAWRSESAAEAGGIGGLALGVGYLVAGVGPLAMGLLLDLTGAYTVPLAVLVAAGIGQLVSVHLIGDLPKPDKQPDPLPDKPPDKQPDKRR